MALSNIQKIVQREEMTKSVLSIGQATIACLQNTRNFMWQAMCGTPGVRKGRQITSENLGNTDQVAKYFQYILYTS